MAGRRPLLLFSNYNCRSFLIRSERYVFAGIRQGYTKRPCGAALPESLHKQDWSLRNEKGCRKFAICCGSFRLPIRRYPGGQIYAVQAERLRVAHKMHASCCKFEFFVLLLNCGPPIGGAFVR